MEKNEIETLKTAYYRAKSDADALAMTEMPYKSEFGEHPAKTAENLKWRLSELGVTV